MSDWEPTLTLMTVVLWVAVVLFVLLMPAACFMLGYGCGTGAIGG